MYIKIKRFIDIIVSITCLILLFPFLLLIGILIKSDSKGSILFKQKRIGKDGKVFEIYKFRSMIAEAEKNGSGVYSAKGDVRVTRIGKIIRALSIDELPQFINIIKGDMSLIGPRPVLTYHPWSFEEYSQEQKKRFLVRPGVTGLAQVHGRKSLLWEKRIEYDIKYVENLSLFQDVKIFFKTIINIISMKDNVNTIETVKNPEELPEMQIKN